MLEFKYVMLMVPDVEAAAKFYSEGLGLTVKSVSPGWGELDAGGTTIALHSTHGQQAETGSSPILSFNVTDIDAVIATLSDRGGRLEGDVREPPFGKVAAIRTPDGHLLSLLQPAAVAAS